MLHQIPGVDMGLLFPLLIHSLSALPRPSSGSTKLRVYCYTSLNEVFKCPPSHNSKPVWLAFFSGKQKVNFERISWSLYFHFSTFPNLLHGFTRQSILYVNVMFEAFFGALYTFIFILSVFHWRKQLTSKGKKLSAW